MNNQITQTQLKKITPDIEDWCNRLNILLDYYKKCPYNFKVNIDTRNYITLNGTYYTSFLVDYYNPSDLSDFFCMLDKKWGGKSKVIANVMNSDETGEGYYLFFNHLPKVQDKVKYEYDKKSCEFREKLNTMMYELENIFPENISPDTECILEYLSDTTIKFTPHDLKSFYEVVDDPIEISFDKKKWEKVEYGVDTYLEEYGIENGTRFYIKEYGKVSSHTAYVEEHIEYNWR